MTTSKKLRFSVRASVSQADQKTLPLPSLLTGAAARGGGQALDPLLAGITVKRRYELAATTRGEGGEAVGLDTAEPELLAVETEDGTTLFIRSDTLAESVAQITPDAVNEHGEVDFSRFRDPNATARGINDVLWRAVSVLELPADGLLETAKELALKWAKEELNDLAIDKAYDVGSYLGAKALMWTIESQLVGRPGLYAWNNQTMTESDRCLPGDIKLTAMAQGKPALIFIHGTGSYSAGAFEDLAKDAATWSSLQSKFPGGIFGYEHRTFSQSPIENALALLDSLPKGARVSLVSHSRGGLVADLLCLGTVDPAAITAYQFDIRNSKDPEGLEREAVRERERLRQILALLADRHIVVERYVRIASPSRGTRFLSDNLDAALSDFLNLLQWGGGALVGTVAGAIGGPVAAERFGNAASCCLGVLKRLVLEIAGRRIDPWLVPGIAAMRIDSPLTRLLAHPDTRRHDGVQMAVIAGDTEFDGFGLSNFRRRIANLFCDWRLFDRNDNDLVVDTDSMYAGLGFRGGAKCLFVQSEHVTHFQYFANAISKRALLDWLDNPDAASQFLPLSSAPKLAWKDRPDETKTRGTEAVGPRPVVILMPGIMGSHIEINRKNPEKSGSGNRIWFDVASLMVGRLQDLKDTRGKNIWAEDLFETIYGDLADYLAKSHKVIRFPYDWRKPLADAAKALAKHIDDAAEQYPNQPIRLLAHSMGGLVARALMKDYPDAWRKIVDSGGRLLMLGTPNHGSHLMVHALLGKSDSVRKLAVLDARNDLQDIVDIVANFPGALALLPRPGFVDTGNVSPGVNDYYSTATWEALKAKNHDRWFGDNVGGEPSPAMLNEVKHYWDRLKDQEVSNPECIAYVHGQADKTPCGVKVQGDRLQLLFTPYGDGSVTWQSGKIDALEQHSWYMPVEHADLAGEAAYFPAIVELLEKGVTDELGRLPRMRGDVATTFTLEAEPPVLAADEELTRAMLGSGPRRRRAGKQRQVLKVGVHAGDLSYIDQPLLCGHYIGDAISGAEAKLNDKLGGALTERDRLGIYAGEIGSSVIVLRPPSDEEQKRKSLSGAVVVGLGQYTGQLSARQITETVRAAVVRYLLQLRDTLGSKPGESVQLYSVLLGWGSAANISVAESVSAVTRGVLEANRQFSDAADKSEQQVLMVDHLFFIELYRDAAITAAHVVLDLPELLDADLKRIGARLEPVSTLQEGVGVLDRLTASNDSDHWARLIVTDADASDIECPLECYEVRYQSPIPRDSLRRLFKQCQCMDNEPALISRKGGGDIADGNGTPPTDTSPTRSRYYPERLKYVLLSTRARAESVWQRRQPGLVEEIISQQAHNPAYDRQLGHTLFQLMVPLDFKAAAREQSRLLLVLDSYCANLPWELLQVDGEPLVLRGPVIRQLSTSNYRRTVRSASNNAVCIIVNPSTFGFNKRFPGDLNQLDNLNGAEREGAAISASLRSVGWHDITLTPPDKKALDIFNVLYERPYRILVIAAHGLFEAQAKDGQIYTGVVLSDGLLITAVEIRQMEVVPEVVFLSCCHLGGVSNPYSKPNRLAYSLARELIEMGVRCVVAAGWAVNDEAACTFASTFFDRLCAGRQFGEAIFEARKATFALHPASNTWGAYQAYGDPSYRLHLDFDSDHGNNHKGYVAIEELLAALSRQRLGRKNLAASGKRSTFAEENRWLQQQLAKCPVDWSQRPEVLQALGDSYAEFGADGFDAAREAYQKAIHAKDEQGKVSIRSIEQLANLEARRGGELAESGQFAKAETLINGAIQRISKLTESVGGDAGLGNAERNAILGSAYKRKASLLAWQGAPWGKVIEALRDSVSAYHSVMGDDPASNPYQTLNYLPLAWLAEALPYSTSEAVNLASRCGDSARKRFANDKTFWNAVMSADADMTAWLIGGKLLEPPVVGSEPTVEDECLYRRYEEAVRTVPQSAREWDSVVKQWRLLAVFLRLRQAEGDGNKADILDRLADRYLPRQANKAGARDNVQANVEAATNRQGHTMEGGQTTKTVRGRRNKKDGS